MGYCYMLREGEIKMDYKIMKEHKAYSIKRDRLKRLVSQRYTESQDGWGVITENPLKKILNCREDLEIICEIIGCPKKNIDIHFEKERKFKIESPVWESFCLQGNNFISSCLKGDVKSVKKFLKEGVSINFCENLDENTALISCSQSGISRMVKFLLELGCNHFIRNSDRKTALGIALEYKQYECAEILISYGAKE